MTKHTYIDLFAGCGGLSLGLHQSKCWHGIFAVEKSADAFETLEHNLIKTKKHFSWPEWLGKPKNHDINELLEKYEENLMGLRGEIDLVAGGPPCQGFSMAGRRVEADQRNNLVHSYLRFIELVQPKMILFENVKGFKIGFKKADDTRGEPYSEVVLRKLIELGYLDARAEILDFSEFGVPQRRKRCIIVATKNDQSGEFFELLKENSSVFLNSKGLKSRPNLGDAISDIRKKHGKLISPDSKRFAVGKYAKEADSPYQELLRTNEKGGPDSHRFANHTDATTRKFRAIIKDELTSQEVRERFNTKKCSTRLLKSNQPTPTLTTLPDDYVHYDEPRILTVREYARIQSFPDDYEFKGKYTTGGERRKLEVPRYTQVGNAIPPLFAEQAGLNLQVILNHG